MTEVLCSGSIRRTTSRSFKTRVDGALLLDYPARNTSKTRKSDQMPCEWPSSRDHVTQALDGFAIAGPMICKLRPLKII
jgi:hypothetical protein